MASLPCTPPCIFVFFLFLICIIVTSPWPRAAADSYENRLHNDTLSLTEASKDYGNIFRNVSSYVLQPSSVDDIINLTRSLSNKTIAARGNGHSVRGQAMALGGVVVNMTALSDPYRIEIGGNTSSGYYADVEGGQLWIDVLRATLRHGLAPVSWTDYLYLTVGGTLSNEGISGQTFLHGPQITKVLQLEVVTGKGEFITCSPDKNPELFFGVLGGLGQFGIIIKARIVLDTAPIRAKWARTIYSDFSLFTKDQEYLISCNASSYVEGFLILNARTIKIQWSPPFSISPSQQLRIAAMLKNHKILYSIELAMYYHNQTAQTIYKEFETLHKKLNFIKGLNFSKDVSFFNFLNRVGNLDNPKRGSLLSHPWLNLFIPKSHIFDFNKRVLATMLPRRLSRTSGLFIFYPINKKRWDDRMSAVTSEVIPADKNVIYTLGLLHSSQHAEYRKYDAFNNDVMDVCRKADIKVKQYVPNYKTQEEWKRHFGFKWKIFYDRKILFDPRKKLSPGQGIFN
ncbi:cytokinin dehydrogenase 4 [Phtheirospermum japonicum]|uniref:cytokinin dehydrogenase n=1 Tax=Phtheirospermum japonicum TaxID=374723 RepID=A0A830CSS7_9LAMI|nr:cytokinin dehydrogenase 4 [Phtheirospermum japonicum]